MSRFIFNILMIQIIQRFFTTHSPRMIRVDCLLMMFDLNLFFDGSLRNNLGSDSVKKLKEKCDAMCVHYWDSFVYVDWTSKISNCKGLNLLCLQKSNSNWCVSIFSICVCSSFTDCLPSSTFQLKSKFINLFPCATWIFEIHRPQ